MPITIGHQPDHGFDQPLGLLRDCHRRIERFLGVLKKIVAASLQAPAEASLSDEHRSALETSLRYFKEAAPRHTQDEEASLFPRLREICDPRVIKALAKIDELETEHVKADFMHSKVDTLGRTWLKCGTASRTQLEQLDSLLSSLLEIYQRHIAEEDNVIFPLAAEVLTPGSLADIGSEMARRRGLDPSPAHAR